MKKKLTLLIALSIIIFWMTLPLLGMIAKAPEVEKPVEIQTEELDLSIPQFKDKDFGGDISEEEYQAILLAEKEQKAKEEARKKREEEEAARKRAEAAKKAAAAKQVKAKTPAPVQKKVEQGNYATATQIWNFLKGLGYTDAQAAGIMGNMMVESGGNTLNINPSSHNSAHWGICQWSRKYFPQLWGSNLDQQLKHFKTWVHGVPNGSVDNVAYWFWKNYERSGHYSQKRAECAWKAYNYFHK